MPKRWVRNHDFAAKILTPEQRRQAFFDIPRLVRRDRLLAEYDLANSAREEGFVAENVYLRFGDVPQGRRSALFGITELGKKLCDSEAGTTERSISVFGGRLTSGGNYMIDLSRGQEISLQWDLIGCCEQQRRAYFVRGKTLRGNKSSRGRSGEPLLKSISLFEEVPGGCIVAASYPSMALEDWNRRRGVLPEDSETEKMPSPQTIPPSGGE